MTVFEIAIPVFGVMLIGYGAASLGFFSKSACDGLTRFVFNFAIPVMLFRNLAGASLPDAIPWGHLASFYASAGVVFGIGMLVAFVQNRQSLDRMALAGLTAGYANIVLIGLPLVLLALGEQATLPALLIIAFHSAILITAATLLVEISRGSQSGLRSLPLHLLKATFTNPIIVGLMAGLLFAFSGSKVPDLLDGIARLLSGAAAPCALFAMGAALPQFRLVGNIGEAAALTAIKLLVQPALVWVLATYVLDVDPLYRQTAVILAACPVGANTYLLAARYEVGAATATTSVFLSTGLSMITLPVLLWMVLTP